MINVPVRSWPLFYLFRILIVGADVMTVDFVTSIRDGCRYVMTMAVVLLMMMWNDELLTDVEWVLVPT